ncbi:Prolyl 4-hydroxylase, alpha polypeptide, partial [Halocaridina rubra]
YVSDYRELNREQRGSSNVTQSVVNLGETSSVVAHPIDAYLLLKRLTVEWATVEDAMIQHANATHELVQRVILFREGSSFPVIEDLHGAAVALVRLQDTYNLNMTTLPTGTFTGVGLTSHEYQSNKPLNARDCLFLGKHAFNKGFYNKAIEWFEAALDMADAHHDTSASRDEIEPFLEAAVKVHDDILEKRGPKGADWQTNPVPVNKSLARKLRYMETATKRKFIPKLYQHQSDEEEAEHYARLCRGETLRPIELESSLKCRYVSNQIGGYFMLMPLQLEEMSLDPYIVVFHNFLTGAQTDTLIEMAKPKV